MASADKSSFESLPAEIINQIFTLLPPLSLVNVSQTSVLLHSHAQDDLLWANHVRENVPTGSQMQSPAPCKTWKELYISHHPYWFLPRGKIWFSDRSYAGSTMTGQVILSCYDRRRGGIEAYRLVAEHGDEHLEQWEWNPHIVIHTFNPNVTLWFDNPVIKLDLGWHKAINHYQREKLTRSQQEILMKTGGGENICSSISLCQTIAPSLQNSRMALWPPAILPTTQRVRNESQSKFRGLGHKPRSIAEASDSTFRIRKWLDFQGPGSGRMGEDVMTFSTIPEEYYKPTKQKPWQGIWVGDYPGHGCEFLVILQREVHPNQPAIAASKWSSQSSFFSPASSEQAGDTSEISALNEPPSAPEALGDEINSILQGEACEAIEPPEDGSCWGRLEAIKLTGDPNVPRGEYTWIAEDIGPKGLIRIADERIFRGARVVRSLGHIAERGFLDGRWPLSWARTGGELMDCRSI